MADNNENNMLGGIMNFFTNSPIGGGLALLFGVLTVPRLIGGLFSGIFGGGEEGESQGPGIMGWIMGLLGAAALFIGGRNLFGNLGGLFGGTETPYDDDLERIGQTYENSNRRGANSEEASYQASYAAAANTLATRVLASDESATRFTTVESILGTFSSLDAQSQDAAVDIAEALKARPNITTEQLQERLGITG